MSKDYCVKNKGTGKWDRLFSIGTNDYGSEQITVGPKEKQALRDFLASDDWGNIAIFENEDKPKAVKPAPTQETTPINEWNQEIDH